MFEQIRRWEQTSGFKGQFRFLPNYGVIKNLNALWFASCCDSIRR